MAAVVTLSMEVELAWGVHDLGEFANLSEDGASERAYLDRLLDRCDAVDIPISFDVVGHPCQAACDGNHPGPHAPGWFDADPGTDVTSDPLYYAPDMVSNVRERETAHEVCTHTYSHVPFDTVSEETIAWEFERSQSVHERVCGERTASLVPPRHRRAPARLLRDADVEIQRMSRDTDDGTTLDRAKELLVGPHPVFEPALVDGVVETYCSSYPSLSSSALPAGQRPPPRVLQSMPRRFRQYLHRRYLERAVDHAVATDGYCHLWCHLYDICNEYQWPGVDAFLGYLADRRAAGDVEVLTMAELNEHCRSRQTEVTARASHG